MTRFKSILKGRAVEIKRITPELRDKAAGVTDPEELLKLAKAEGVELTDEQMENISGGDWDDSNNCPLRHRECEMRHGDAYYCPDCNLDFLVV